MHDSLKNILGLYAGVLLVNVILSAVLWYKQRTALHRSLFFVWISSVIAFVVQGATSEGSDLVIMLGFCSAFLIGISLAHLFAQLLDLSIATYKFFLFLLVGAITTVGMHRSGMPFQLAAFPIAVPVMFPILHTTFRVVRYHRDRLTTAGTALAVVCFVLCLHVLDFPILRPKPNYTVPSFTIVIIIVFGLSVTATAVVLESVTTDRARIAQLNQIQRQFFANISHELRTPLTLILASLQELLERVKPGRERNDIDIAQRNAGRLLRLIDELLDLSKLNAGGLRLTLSPTDFRAVAASLVETSQPMATTRNITLRLDAPESISPITADAHRVEIILTNLIGNALKYTPPGGHITVEIRENAKAVIARVVDTGPGIPEADIAHIFDRFYQVNSSDRRKVGGVGIGLSLAKELTELHGGKLTVASEVGKGTVFSLRLLKGSDHIPQEFIERRKDFRPASDYRRIEDPKDSLPADIETDGIAFSPKDDDEPVVFEQNRRGRVLLVDDQQELRDYIASLLSESYEVILASDGEEGFALAKRENPDLIVSDVMMPRKTGTELCQEVKNNPTLREIPVILLTARVGSEATLEAYAHGADDFVAKPFHPRVLLARVRAQLRLRSLRFQLVSREKFAAVGTLAAGIAHEVKNPINSISNAAEVLLTSTPKPELAQKLLHVVKDGAKRINDIVSALDSHVRPAEKGALVPFDVREGLDATLRLLEYRMKDVTVVRNYHSERSVLTPAGPVNQVFLNLIDNALRCGATHLELSVHDFGQGVRVSVSDNGPGVPKEIAERVFDPFFTTREPGEGTGLGLYLSRQIVVEQGGDLRLETNEKGGARFVIELPGQGAKQLGTASASN